ncbi:MAG: hypothetical protein V2I51_23145 [Anderseniella sp.]|jgi:hypothetical protein|nr:hypothetical protein [Anderseniella sp.]
MVIVAEQTVFVQVVRLDNAKTKLPWREAQWSPEKFTNTRVRAPKSGHVPSCAGCPRFAASSRGGFFLLQSLMKRVQRHRQPDAQAAGRLGNEVKHGCT